MAYQAEHADRQSLSTSLGRERGAVETRGNPLFGAAVLKLTLGSRLARDPGMRELYEGALADLGVRATEVDVYIAEHRAELEAALEKGSSPG